MTQCRLCITADKVPLKWCVPMAVTDGNIMYTCKFFTICVRFYMMLYVQMLSTVM